MIKKQQQQKNKTKTKQKKNKKKQKKQNKKKLSLINFLDKTSKKAIMSFDLHTFVIAPSWELLNLAKKSDLLDIAARYKLTNVKKPMIKQEIKNILVLVLVDKEILDFSALSLVLVTHTGLQMRELEIQKQMELEKLRLEQERQMQKERMEMEERVLKERMEMEERVQKDRMVIEEREKEKGR